MLHRSERVRDLAYSLWEQQGRPVGRDLEHWLEAERRLGRERHAPALEIVAEALATPKKGRKAKRK